MPQPNNQPKKHRTRANAAMKTRTLFCVTLFIVGAFGLLIYQLYALQLRDAELYRTEAVTQQLKDTTLPALRGSIYSVNGKLLAKSSTVWNIVADPSSIAKSGASESQLRTAAENIAALLGGDTTADTVYEVLTAKNSSGEPYQYRMLAKGVDKPVVDSILNYADEYHGSRGRRHDRQTYFVLFDRTGHDPQLPLRRVPLLGAGLLQQRWRGRLRPGKILR